MKQNNGAANVDTAAEPSKAPSTAPSKIEAQSGSPGSSVAELSPDEFELKVKKVMSKQLGRSIKDLHGKLSLKSDLGADSLDLVSLVLALEEDLGVELPDAQASKIVTIQDAIDIYRNLSPAKT